MEAPAGRYETGKTATEDTAEDPTHRGTAKRIFGTFKKPNDVGHLNKIWALISDDWANFAREFKYLKRI